MSLLSENENAFLTHEVHSESTLPLLQWLLRTQQQELLPDSEQKKTDTEIFKDVKGGVGKDARPIPDESELVEGPMLNLIAKGPDDGKPIGQFPDGTIPTVGKSYVQSAVLIAA